MKQEFIKEAFVIAPNSESSESIELLTGVLNNLDLYEWIFPNKQPGPNSDFNNPIYGDWKQDVNLHYVGITRARKGCFFISSSVRKELIMKGT